MLTDVSEVCTASIIRAINEPREGIGYIGVQVDWADQWEMGDDRRGNGPIGERSKVEKREV
jgi:hypothetical protein